MLGGKACDFRVTPGEDYVVTLAPGVAIARFSASTASQHRTDTAAVFQGRPAITSTLAGSTSSCLVAVAVTPSDLVVVAGSVSTAPDAATACLDAQVFAGAAVTGWEVASTH